MGRALPLSAQDKSVKKFTFLTDRAPGMYKTFRGLFPVFSLADKSGKVEHLFKSVGLASNSDLREIAAFSVFPVVV